MSKGRPQQTQIHKDPVTFLYLPSRIEIFWIYISNSHTILAAYDTLSLVNAKKRLLKNMKLRIYETGINWSL